MSIVSSGPQARSLKPGGTPDDRTDAHWGQATFLSASVGVDPRCGSRPVDHPGGHDEQEQEREGDNINDINTVAVSTTSTAARVAKVSDTTVTTRAPSRPRLVGLPSSRFTPRLGLESTLSGSSRRLADVNPFRGTGWSAQESDLSHPQIDRVIRDLRPHVKASYRPGFRRAIGLHADQTDFTQEVHRRLLSCSHVGDIR